MCSDRNGRETVTEHLRSLFLAETFLHRPNLLTDVADGPGQRTLKSTGTPTFPPILELGAGTGFLSIFLSQIGCGRIWSSDVGDDEAGTEDSQETDEAEGKPEFRFASETRRRGPLNGLIANLELSESTPSCLDPRTVLSHPCGRSRSLEWRGRAREVRLVPFTGTAWERGSASRNGSAFSRPAG